MKRISIIGLVVVAMTSGMLTTSCEDMLTIDNGDKIYTNANDTLYSYLGILKCMQDVAERQVILGELRGDLVRTTDYVTDTLYSIANFNDPSDGSCSMLNISDYYDIINNCNFYIANCDTNLVKSNEKYMLPEYAQVQAIRAWSYLQLVKNYGSVPFITEPVTSLDVIDNFDYEGNQVTKDNLVDKIVSLGLPNFVDTDYPEYGYYNNGATTISARYSFIPVRVVLGDLYLLRGNGTSDYRTAAKYYFDYLYNLSYPMSEEYCTATKLRGMSIGGSEYGYSSMGWGTWASLYTFGTSRDNISSIASSANKQFGTILSRVADIYGYTPTSSQSTEVEINDDDEEEVSTSGAISVSRNYKAQAVPSDLYKALNQNQTYVYYETNSAGRSTRNDYECGDARYSFSTEEFTYDGDAYLLCCKAAKSSNFYYTIPIYRKTLIWLRLAEAINRAGYPQIAFGILKDGLNKAHWPKGEDVTTAIYNARVDANGDTIYNEDGSMAVDTTYQTEYVITPGGSVYQTLAYVDSTELNSFFLDFSNTVFDNTYGIHARGCGYGRWTSTVANVTNITGVNDTINYDYYKLLAAQGVDASTASDDEIINAVENIIVDELALETAFEGNRFTDLVRIAEHKNASGFNGTEWLADKVASRNIYITSEASTGEKDTDLYNKLLDTSKWYFSKPEWTVNK